MGERYVPRETYDGQEHEYDVFGKFRETPEYRAALERMGAANRYVDFERSLHLVEKFSQEDPHNPKQEFLRDLRIELADKLDMDENVIGAYTAVGTPLDIFHGADAFLRIQMTQGGNIIVTLDATLSKEKLSGIIESKADVLIGDIPSPESDAYLESVETYANKIAKIIKERLKRKTKEDSAHP